MESCKKVEVKRMTIDEAKKIYFKYDCSLFAMAREEKEVYEDYRKLKISSLVENEWRKELFTILAQQLNVNGESEVFNRMYKISENQHDKDRLLMLKQALTAVNFKDLKTRVYISETVLGRKELSERTGMVFWAYDLGEREIAKELLVFVLTLLNSHTVGLDLQARFERSKRKCYLINSELNLDVCK